MEVINKFVKRIALVIVFFISGMSVYAQNAHDIVEKADQKLKGNTNISTMKITIIRPRWTREMTMKSWAKGDQFSMILITSPKRDAGTVFLKRGNEIWNWVPAIERNIKLPPSMMMQDWMGTDFKNDDLVKQSSMVADYNQELLGDSIIEGRDCYKIKMIPKPDAAVVWGKVLLWIDKKDYLELRTEFYDEDNYLMTTLIASNIKMLGGKLLPATMTMIPAGKPGNKTVMEFLNITFDQPIADNFFTTAKMKTIK